ncbi:MAG TPA: hypothetical protein GXX30_01605 [Firmicutes bacterium]|nr:hypothetical protein [Candidatus Fermentithermobacillaceae bacterium]
MHLAKGNVFSFWLGVLFAIVLFVLISRARKGMKIPPLYKVPGLDALDEAIGRCTEMGRPVHFSPGIGSVDNAQTLAALSILGYVARQCAKYDTDLIATNRITVVYPIAEEIVKQAYIEEGKPDAFKPENVRFISEDQFAYASGVTGIMYREKPAANILIGAFWAESLIFAEVGATAGAIQISGTANTHQIPFFVAACDYALIGEEIFAASAYLTKDPVLMGSLVAQDWGKMLAAVLIVIGAVLQTFKITALKDLMGK